MVLIFLLLVFNPQLSSRGVKSDTGHRDAS